MAIGKNGGCHHAGQDIVQRAVLLGGPVDVEDGARVTHRREERQPEHVVVVQVGEQARSPAAALPAPRSGGVQMVAQGAEASPQIEDQGMLAFHLHQDAGRVAPVTAVPVGRARARAPDSEEGDPHRRCRLVGRHEPGRRDYPPDHGSATGDRQRRRFRLPRATGRPTGRWPCACTGSPTPPTPGGTCSPGWPTPATTPWPRSCAATPRPRCRRTAATTRGRWPSTPAHCTRPWGDRDDAVHHRPRLGAPSPPTGPRPYQPDRWRRVVDRRGGPPGRRWPTGSSPSTSCAGAGTSSSSRPRWPSTRSRWRTTPSSTGCGPTGRPGSTARGMRPR